MEFWFIPDYQKLSGLILQDQFVLNSHAMLSGVEKLGSNIEVFPRALN
jgi:hypothetical protein